jgi:Ala-tRNA(Pro) deacylase
MLATRQQLLALLDDLGVAYTTHDHPPVFTVAESGAIKIAMPGGHTKNLFLKDKKGGLFLVSALADTAIDLNALSKTLGVGRFSFGSAALLLETLGVHPGSVTAFAVINDKLNRVRIVLDEGLLGHALVNFHPLSNDATTAVTPAGLLRLFDHTGHHPTRVAFTADGASRIVHAG